jgi:CheY-like chemotaxis protein
MKVLLVDDEQSILDVFGQTLQTAGFQVITASNGNEALQKVKNEIPDVILLDQVLPDINGNQVLQTIKADPTTKNIPTAILSNFNQGGLVGDALNTGAVDYILKYQVEPKDLVEKVKQLAAEHAEKSQSDVTNPSASMAQIPEQNITQT